MAKRQADSEDALKRQARRRLIGAVALVTAVVIILPMILDREPNPSGQNIDLRIPDKNKAGEFTSQMVLPEPHASAPIATNTPPATTTPVAGKPVKMKPLEVKPAGKAKPAPAKPVHKPSSKPAPAPAKTKTVQTKAGFAVQIGAFSNANSANELKDKLGKQGWHAYTEKAGGNVRVRVGNYPTREAAEEALHKLEAQGMHPAVVTVP
jgi:DedD protein